MNWTIAGLPGSRAAAAAALLSLGGCSTGPVGEPPPVTRPTEAGAVTFYRNDTVVGLGTAMNVRLDGRELVRLGRKEHYSFRADPGEYVIDFNIGLNECRRVILVEPGRSYRYRLVPSCLMEDESARADYPL